MAIRIGSRQEYPVETRQSSPVAHRWIKFLILSIFVAGFVAFFALGGDQWLNLQVLKAQRNSLLLFTENHYFATLLAAVLIYTAAIALSLPGAIILSLAVGLMFGRWVGTAVIIFSATLGATLVFLAARYLFADTVQKRECLQLFIIFAIHPLISLLADQSCRCGADAHQFAHLCPCHFHRHNPRHFRVCESRAIAGAH